MITKKPTKAVIMMAKAMALNNMMSNHCLRETMIGRAGSEKQALIDWIEEKHKHHLIDAANLVLSLKEVKLLEILT